MEYLEASQYIVMFALMNCINVTIKQHHVLTNLLNPVLSRLPSSIRTFVMCSLCGVLPVPGRVVITSMCLDCTHKPQANTGLLAYISSHHYYLWSPAEKSVIVCMVGLGISYSQFIEIMWVPLAIYVIFMVWCAYDTQIADTISLNSGSRFVWMDGLMIMTCLMSMVIKPHVMIGEFKLSSIVIAMILMFLYFYCKYRPAIGEMMKSFEVTSVCVLSVMLMLATYVKHHVDDYDEYIVDQHIFMVCVVSFVVSFLLGSSSKFSAVCVMCTLMYGMEYFCLFYIVDFCGYLMSPFHKCLPISIIKFNTSLTTMYTYLLILCIILTTYCVVQLNL